MFGYLFDMCVEAIALLFCIKRMSMNESCDANKQRLSVTRSSEDCAKISPRDCCAIYSIFILPEIENGNYP